MEVITLLLTIIMTAMFWFILGMNVEKNLSKTAVTICVTCWFLSIIFLVVTLVYINP